MARLEEETAHLNARALDAFDYGGRPELVEAVVAWSRGRSAAVPAESTLAERLYGLTSRSRIVSAPLVKSASNFLLWQSATPSSLRRDARARTSGEDQLRALRGLCGASAPLGAR